MGRYKSRKYVHGDSLAFPVFGEIRTLMNRPVLRIWIRDVPEPYSITFETMEQALEHKARLIEVSLDHYLEGRQENPRERDA